MCSHYQAIKERERYAKHFIVPPIDAGKHDVWPCYPATFIRRPREVDVGDEAVPDREALPGLFGLIPHWATDTNIGRQTYNARTETVAAKPSFRDAWKNAQHCVIPVDAFFEHVMVNAEQPDLRLNRLGLLKGLHAAMNHVADLSKLAT